MGGLALAGLTGLIGLAVFLAATSTMTSLRDVTEGLLDWNRAGYVAYPLLAVGVGGLGLRKLLRAGIGRPRLRTGDRGTGGPELVTDGA